MKCTDFERNVLSLASDQLADASLRDLSLAHVRLCNHCANRLTEEQNLIAGIRAVQAELAAETTPLRVELGLINAIRIQANSAAAVSSWQRTGLNAWQVGAVAAAILVLIATVSFFWQHPASSEEQVNITSAPPARPSEPSPQLLSGASEAEHVHVSRQKRVRPRSSAPRAAARDKEVVTEFFPLIAGDDLSALENIRLVRVELPGSALGEVGLPSPPAAETTLVRAEVLFGQDGVARAIRFVQ
ncbi:MAG TPA: hypothetical protein VKB46_09325 [Pyrinomonadaceae bacterium]|nr:hypothetical protein [Pyrinomonadaceae bacterium]